MREILNSIHGSAIRRAFALRYGATVYGKYAAFLEESQWWPWGKIQELQIEKLYRLLEHAYTAVPFYRQCFRERGVRPASIKEASDLGKLPILTKRDLQERLPSLLAEGFEGNTVIQNYSGGSTGQPTKVFQDQNYKAWEKADLLRSYRMAGYRLGARWAFLWGSDRDAREHKGVWGLLKDRLIYNLVWINTFDLTYETLLTAAERLTKWKPNVIVAYVSSATLLARLVRQRKITGIAPHAIQTSAEVLTREARQLIESTFGCGVFDRYGCREVGNIAHECAAHTGLHVLAENNLVELLDQNGRQVAPGKMGRVVVTNLNNYVMPLVRYDTGDAAVAGDGDCPCGRGLPLIKSIQGRASDVIVSPSGKLLHGEFFSHLFYRVEGVWQFRVVQESLRDLQIEIVPSAAFEEGKTLSFLSEAIKKYGDPEFAIHFKLKRALDPSPSGKHRFTISKVSNNLG